MLRRHYCLRTFYTEYGIMVFFLQNLSYKGTHRGDGTKTFTVK